MRIGVILAVASSGVSRAASLLVPSAETARQGSGAPEDGAAELTKAFACFERGEVTQCLDFLRLARKGNPDVLPAEVILAELYLRENQVASARDVLEQAAVAEPACPQTYLLLARLALAEARTAEAEALFEKAHARAAAAGYSEAARKRFRAEACAGLATIGERRGDWSGAADRLGAWIELSPRDGQVRCRLARVRFRLGIRERTHEELQQALKDDPTVDPPAMTMAVLYTEAGDLKKATEWVAHATGSGAQDPRVQLGAALWYLDQDQPDRARVHAEAAAKLNSVSAPIKEARALIAWHLKNYSETERICQELVIEAPAKVFASALWALALAEQPAEAKRSRALQLAESLVRIDPSSSTALTTLGWIYYRNGRRVDAERVLRAALSNGSAPSDAAYYLARVLADRGRDDEVVPLLKLCLRASGRFAFRTEAREWLARLAK